jgi:hypothetical protein
MQPSGKTKTAYCLSTLRIQQYHPNHSSIEKKGMTQNSNAGMTAAEAATKMATDRIINPSRRW